MSADGQRTKWCRNIAENFNRLSRVHERYRQTTDDRQTDGRPMTYSERESEFTFAKNDQHSNYSRLQDNCKNIYTLLKLNVLFTGYLFANICIQARMCTSMCPIMAC